VQSNTYTSITRIRLICGVKWIRISHAFDLLNAVFGNTNGVIGTLQGITQANDEVMEEWFSKIYDLTKVGSSNYRVYVMAQMLTPAGVPKGPIMRRFYEVHNRQNNESPPTCSLVITRRADY